MKLILLAITALFLSSQSSRKPLDSRRYELLSGVRKGNDQKSFWDRKYSDQRYVFGKSPAKFLSRNFEYIPTGAKVLDLGMGEGRNAVFLARKGYNVTGIDISSVAVKKARLLAREFGVRINTIVASLDKYEFPAKSFDAIICFYYVDRDLHNHMMKWLKPGGVLIYESYTDNQKMVRGYEKYEKKFLLRPGELLELFPRGKILKYEEPLHMKEYTASLIVQRPWE